MYAVLSAVRDISRTGKFEAFHMIKSVEDNIADNLLQWVQRPWLHWRLATF